MSCTLCGERGLFRVCYHEDPKVFDIAVCDCRIGQRFRDEASMAMIAARYGVTPGQVQYAEHLLDPEDYPAGHLAAKGSPKDFTAAARTGGKAKL